MGNKYPDLKELIHEIAMLNSESAYKQVFAILFHPIMNFSYSIVKSWETAEEVASDVLFLIWDQRVKMQELGNVRYYAYRTARNMSLNIVKKQTNNPTISLEEIDFKIDLLDSLTPESIIIQEELRLKLEEVIDTLPQQCRMVFKLIKEDGFSYKEAAELLNISPKTVDAHLVNAIKKLTALLKLEFNLI